jgi:hypothetical protein
VNHSISQTATYFFNSLLVRHHERPQVQDRPVSVYQVTQLLPPEDKEFQYRIKNINEPHERVAKERELRRV